MDEQQEFEATKPSREFGFALDRPDPQVWVRRMDFLRDIEGGDDSVIRTIHLRRGLNVLWARPEDPSQPAELFKAGISGHASGKTTFCRLIRYVLGERSFSSESIRQLIRDKFPTAWVVAEIFIGSDLWLVKRPVGVGRQSFATRGAEFNRLLDPSVIWEPYQVFLEALGARTLSGFRVSRFASSDQQIEWPHLLPWLTRDQECRYAKLVVWRDASSQSDSPMLTDDDRAYLVRVVLDMLSEREQMELSRISDLHAKRDRAEANAPKLEHEATSLHSTLTEEYGDEIPPLADSLFVDEVLRRLEAERKTIDGQFADADDEDAMKAAQDRHTRAVEARSKAEAKAEALAKRLEQDQSALEMVSRDGSEEDLITYYSSMPSPEGICSVSVQAAADLGCPVAQRKLGKTVDFTSRSVEHNVRAEIGLIRARIAKLSAQIATAEDAVKEAHAFETACAKDIQALGERQRSTLQIRKHAIERLSKLLWIATRARKVHDEAEKERASIGEITKEIENAKKVAESAREEFKRAMSDFSATFNRVIAALIGEDVTAGASFHGRAVQVSLNCRGDFTSAAIESIKILAFDLAVLSSSIEGRGHHPRFLVHDGPREADMSSAIYRRFFLLAREFERAAKGAEPNFQYIITTTEPPPAELGQKPWLINPILDATTQEGRLLKIDL